MDPFSHILWSAIVFQKSKKQMFWVMFFGIFPDIFSSIPFLIWRFFYFNFNLSLVFGNWSDIIPKNILILHETIYAVMHSLILFLCIAILIYILRSGKLYWPILAWGLHIVIDIFSHSGRSKGIKFLYPFSDFHFSFINWDTVPFVITNAVILGIIGLIILIKRHFKSYPQKPLKTLDK